MKILLKWVLILLCLPVVVWAQTPTGGIDGTVADSSGAVIPGATVNITEVATGRVIKLVTNEVGRYSVRNLVPGKYTVRVEAAGFSTAVIENIPISSGQVFNGNTVMQVGKADEVILVLGTALVVDTTRQVVDTVVTEKDIKDLPLFGRNFLELAALAPGAYIRDGGAIDPTKEQAYRVVGVSGRSGTATRVQVDGIDVTDETVGTTVANFSDESVQEFQLTRSSLDPSTSLTSSGAVNIISKSGSNDIHGSWFYDLYNQDMAARPQYVTKEAHPPVDRKRTGGAAGGPLKKDKLFWFLNYEQSLQTASSVSQNPEFPQLNVTQPFPLDIKYGEGRMDWNATNTLRLFYKFHWDYNIATGGSAVSPFQTLNWATTQTVGFDYTQSRMTHSYRFGYVNFNNQILSQELAFKFPKTPNGIPYLLTVGSYSAGPNTLAPQATYQDNWQNSYEGTFIWGKHTTRFGFDVRRIILGGFANFAGPLQVNGTMDEATKQAIIDRGGNVQDPLEYPFEFFNVGPENGFFNLSPAHNLPHGGHFDTRFGVFAQDSWKIRRNFTLNLGLRWQYDTQFYSNPDVPRDPILARWGKDYDTQPYYPKDLFSPSFGFAWDPKGDGKTVIRGGFYRAFEMNILNNTMFDEFSMLPNGLGPDLYDHTYVTGPDGTPINADGNHPEGDYSDLIGLPIGQMISVAGQVKAAVNQAYSTYQFDPNKGESAFVSSLGLTYGGTIPGKTYRPPYSMQFNIGVQHEIRPRTVITVDFIYNHGVGLPLFLTDLERRRDAGLPNVTALRDKVNSVLGGLTVDEWIAANPTKNISAFGLMNDTRWPGQYPDISRARLWDGGFSKYQAIQINLRGSEPTGLWLRDVGYNVSYSFGLNEASAGVGRVEFIAGPYDNHKPNNKDTFGPTSLDFTHMLTAAGFLTIPKAGVRLNSFWAFRTPPAATVTVPNFGGAVSGANSYFGTDLNGDGSTGTTPRGDVLPLLGLGQFGRNVKSLQDMNTFIQRFNSAYAGNITPHGQALVAAGLFTEAQLIQLKAITQSIPLIPLGNPDPWHNYFTTDLRVDRPINLGKVREGMSIVPFFDAFNLFNYAPPSLYSTLTGRYGALNFDYANAGPGANASDLDATRTRKADTRRVQFGFRFNF